MTPPRLARWLVSRLAPPNLRGAFIDDLDESFARQVEAVGLRRARHWYRRQVFRGVPSIIALRWQSRSVAPRGEAPAAVALLRGLDSVRLDLTYALRAWLRSPILTIVVVVSLALGIGANTTLFTIVRAVLLRPLPYPRPADLVLVTPPGEATELNLVEYAFVKAEAKTLASVTVRAGASETQIVLPGTTVSAIGMPVGAGFLQTLGVLPALGREFSAGDTRLGGPAVAMLSDGLWRRVFGADPGIVGRLVHVNNAEYEVVGVLPPEFWFHQPADVLFPLQPSDTVDDKGRNFEAIARLKSGATLDAANRDLDRVGAAYLRAYPEMGSQNAFRGLSVLPYQRAIVGDVRVNLWLLFGATCLLLGIACTNVAGLLLTRVATRQRELAVRQALGASRFRLWRQFLVEHLTVSAAGGLVGMVGALALTRTVVALVPFPLTTAGPIHVDPVVLGAAGGIAVLTGFLLSLTPLVGAAPDGHADALRAAAHGTSGRQTARRVRGALIIGEVALSATLLVGAALFARTLYRLSIEPLGFVPEGVLTFWTPPPAAADPTARARQEAAIVERLDAIPGVLAVGGVNVLPLTGQSNYPTEREGHPESDIGGMEIRAVTPDYFRAIGMTVSTGRPLATTDDGRATPVVLVNETLARRWWPHQSPLGDHITIGRLNGQPIGEVTEPPRAVVGVVSDAKTVLLTAQTRPTIYVPSAQVPWLEGRTAWAVRAQRPATLSAAVRATIAALDSRLEVRQLRLMTDIVAATTADSRFNAWVCGAFAGLALLLSAIGIYGLLAFSVASRITEIGTRMALGATPAEVIRMVLRQGLTLLAAGLVIGLGTALTLGRVVSTLLFGITPTDLTSYLTVAAILTSVGVAASVVPARRASRTDPLQALRTN